MKKLISLVLVLVMVLGLFAACDKAPADDTKAPNQTNAPDDTKAPETTEAPKELEPVTLRWYIDGKEKEGTADVSKAFNELLAEALPNTTVEFVYVDAYKDNWPMFVSGGEKMDIAWAGWSTPFLQDVMDGNLLPLDDLIAEYGPNLQKEWATWTNSYDSAVYEGQIYGIPGVQPTVSESQYLTVADTLYEYIDMDAFIKEIRENTKTRPELIKLLEDAIEAGLADGAYVDGHYTMVSGFLLACRGYMPLGASKYNMWYDPEAEHPVPLFWWEIPEAKMLYDIWAQYAEEGRYSESQIIGQMPEGSISASYGAGSGYNQNWANADERGMWYVPGKDGKEGYWMVCSNTPLQSHKGTVNFGSASTYLVVPYTAENPERAIMLIDLLRSEDGIGLELMNMLCYGFAKDSEQAEKYGWYNYALTTDADGQPMLDTSVRGEEPSKHDLYNWALGNTFKMIHDGGNLTTKASKDYAMGYFTDVYPKLEPTALDGMIVDYSELTEEFANVNAIKAEYENQLAYGGGGGEAAQELWNEVMDKLNKQGLDAIREELQAQIDAFLAK